MTSIADYPTLTNLVETLRALESHTVRALVVDPISGGRSEETIPAFLFRGESKVYPSICSSRYRFERDTGLSENEKSIIECIGGKLDESLRERGLHSMCSASLLQHYGFPTEVIDTTSSIDVAASFAISDCDTNEPGRILAYPTDKLMKNAVVIDLSMIDWARRPRRQRGFMIFHKNYLDWQHEQLIDDVHVEEHRFTASEVDRQHFDKTAYLIGSPIEDPVCGLLHKLVHDVVLADTQALPSKVADWLNARIPWAQFPCRVISVDSDGRPMEVEPAFDQFADFNINF